MNYVHNATYSAILAFSVLTACATSDTSSAGTPTRSKSATAATSASTMKAQPAPVTTTKDFLRRLQALPCVESAEAELTAGIPEANAPTYETGRATVVVKSGADLAQCAARITAEFPGVMIGHELEPGHMLVVGTADAFHAVDTFLHSDAGKAPDSFRNVSQR